ncbi:MAG: hypothetical protein AB7E60_05365 [Sphingobium sp.]
MTVEPHIIATAASSLGASPADLTGLWNVPGHPELTTGQMLDLFVRMATNMTPEQVLAAKLGRLS